MAGRRRSYDRLVVPDFHGCLMDKPAVNAMLGDLGSLDVRELVFLGDGMDVGHEFANHPLSGLEDLEYSLQADAADANWVLDQVQKRCPRAHTLVYIQGNHEWHIERFFVNILRRKFQAKRAVEALDPCTLLRLKDRGFRYVRYLVKHDGLSVPNTVRLGKCFFTHGAKTGKYATMAMLEMYSANVQHGHTHIRSEASLRTVRDDQIGAWCPGTLSKLQPTWHHTSISRWSHGYGIDRVAPSGCFMHQNVPIVDGVSMLALTKGGR